jgi:hypothetical protein
MARTRPRSGTTTIRPSRALLTTDIEPPSDVPLTADASPANDGFPSVNDDARMIDTAIALWTAHYPAKYGIGIQGLPYGVRLHRVN